MGWYTCYKALEHNNCKTALELHKIDRGAYMRANQTNVVADRQRAWKIAEDKIKEEYNSKK